MFKKCLNIIFFTGIQLVCLSQNNQQSDSISSKHIDSLKQQLHFAKSDSAQMIIVERIGYFYEHLNIDSSLHYFNEALNIAKHHSYHWAEARVLAGISGVMEHRGRYAEAFELLFESLKIAEESNSAYDIARANRRISGVYFELQNYPKAVAYLLNALRIDEANGYKDKVAIDHYALADAYEKINKLDSATFHINISLKQKNLLKGLMQYVYEIDGHIKQRKENYEQAALSYRKGFEEAQLNSDLISSAQICADFSLLYGKRNLKDSAITYALRGFNYAKEVFYKKGIMLNGNLLAELYGLTNPSLALQFYKSAAEAKDSLYGVNSTQAVESLIAREEAKQKELEDAQIAYRSKLKLYGLLTGLAVLLVIAFILYRNNRHKQKANVLLHRQKEKIEATLNELKSTQAQLIQSEKMASLGELTAGIAHEIQNPLNFVNNFSDVNKELLSEMNAEIEKGNYDEVKTIAKDVTDNEEKINHHGKRADSIVKGMLQHSRTSSGQKEPTDINALADEYLRLAYHGLRAKDKSFNADIKTDFDNNIGKINIIPQDIGRVVLNLINNAFYAVDEKKKQNQNGYEPTVSVSTKKTSDKIEIKIKDNGNGIPQKLLDKIFQPFFTTKPTGQGTGLGLSLSYDIVKAHGGELRVETKEGEGTAFIIFLGNNHL
jgi:signal transduction histidine kinase